MTLNCRPPTALAISCIWTASAVRSQNFRQTRPVNLIRQGRWQREMTHSSTLSGRYPCIDHVPS